MSNLTWEDILRVMESIPPNPVKPENQRKARLHPSDYVIRGQMYRLAPQPDFTGHSNPLIVMNSDDVKELALQFKTFVGLIDIHQEIADIAEQLFADQAARERES